MAQAVSEKKTFKYFTQFYTCVYSPVARTVNPLGTKFWLKLKCFTTLIIHCKFQPQVFNTFCENDFSTFSPYKCIQMQIWPYRKEVKGQTTVTIWTNLVDLELSTLYTKIQVQSFIGSWEINPIYQDSAPKLSWFLRRRFLSVFTIYGHGGHLC